MAEGLAVPVLALERSGAMVAAALQANAAKAAAARPLSGMEQHAQWPTLAKLPLKLEVTVPVPRFRVRDLLALKEGQRISTTWQASEDVPLTVGGVQLAWSEFEVVEQRMAIRLTRLA